MINIDYLFESINNMRNNIKIDSKQQLFLRDRSH